MSKDKNEVVLNPASGVMESTPIASAQPSHFSAFDSDEGEDLYTSPIELEGKKVYVRDMTRAEYRHYKTEIKGISEAFSTLFDQSDVEAASDAVEEKQIALYDYVLMRCVGKWELTRPDGTAVPCTLETKLDLRPSVKSTIVDLIVQRSSIGKDSQLVLGKR